MDNRELTTANLPEDDTPTTARLGCRNAFLNIID